MSEQSNLTVGAWKDVERGHDRTSTRAVGDFLLTVDASADGWKWWATWGDNDIAEGETTLTRADNDVSDAWAHSLPRAKADCEEAARRAGIAVPVALTVGAALALPQVQDGTHALEAIIGLIPEQWACRPDENGDAIVMVRMWRPLARRWRPWSMMSPDGRQFLHPCRLVPLSSCDADPATRGDL